MIVVYRIKDQTLPAQILHICKLFPSVPEIVANGSRNSRYAVAYLLEAPRGLLFESTSSLRNRTFNRDCACILIAPKIQLQEPVPI